MGFNNGKYEALKDSGNFFETTFIRFPALTEGFDLRNYLRETRQYDDLIDLESSIDTFIEETHDSISSGVGAKILQ